MKQYLLGLRSKGGVGGLGWIEAVGPLEEYEPSH